MATSQIWQRIAGRLGRPYNFRLGDTKLRGFCLEEVGKFSGPGDQCIYIYIHVIYLKCFLKPFPLQYMQGVQSNTYFHQWRQKNIMLATKHCGIKFDPSFPCITWDTATIASKSLASPSYSRWYPNAVSKIAWGWRRIWELREFHCAEILKKKYTLQTLSIPKSHHPFIIHPYLYYSPCFGLSFGIDFHISFTHQSDILLRLVDAILQASSLMLNDSTETSSPFQPISCGKLHPKTQWFLPTQTAVSRVNPPIHFRKHWQSLILPILVVSLHLFPKEETTTLETHHLQVPCQTLLTYMLLSPCHMTSVKAFPTLKPDNLSLPQSTSVVYASSNTELFVHFFGARRDKL